MDLLLLSGVLPLSALMMMSTLMYLLARGAIFVPTTSGYTRTSRLVVCRRLMHLVLVLGDCYSLLAMIRAVFTLSG